MTLSAEELERYARHIVLREVGGPGQQRLKAARVLVVGAGGIGSPALLYLAAAGVGTLGVVDDDKVSLSNLQRQVIHATADLGRLKTDSAGTAIRRLNPHVVVEPHAVRLQASNAIALISAYDVVLDGSDNFATRYLVSDACFFAKRALVTAALGTFRRDADYDPRPRDGRRWQTESYLSLPIPRAAAAGHRAGLRRSRHSGRARRRRR